MAGGVAEFRRKHGPLAAKVDADPGLPAPVRANFWTCVEGWAAPDDIEALFDRCCQAYQFVGPNALLSHGEQLGTAQKLKYFPENFQVQAAPGLPAYTRVQAEHYMNTVVHESDEGIALNLFRRYFGPLRLRPPAAPNARLFAFRNPGSPTNPLLTNLRVLFANLAIPGANAVDYVILAFHPGPGDQVRVPTSLDARFQNLAAFAPGGQTAGGILEVITTPPRCNDVTSAPRHIR